MAAYESLGGTIATVSQSAQLRQVKVKREAEALTQLTAEPD